MPVIANVQVIIIAPWWILSSYNRVARYLLLPSGDIVTCTVIPMSLESFVISCLNVQGVRTHSTGDGFQLLWSDCAKDFSMSPHTSEGTEDDSDAEGYVL